MDQAKFTDEGWWANAAVRHFLVGHWQVAGDYNPAAVVPVWPLLLTLVFHFTGVSLVAARTVNVSFSIATVAIVYALVRRYGGTETTAALAALLLAASPFAFAFSRLATLDTMVVFEWSLLLWGRFLCQTGARLAHSYPLGILIPIMLLTKTTALVLVPAVLWVLWKKSPRSNCWRLFVAPWQPQQVFMFPSSCNPGTRMTITTSSISTRWQTWTGNTGSSCGSCASLDVGRPHPVSGRLAVLVLSLVWLRQLWRNPLFAASWIALAGDALYFLRRQDDYAPRYFLAMLVPLILVLVFSLQD